jgi:hypothetical protein
LNWLETANGTAMARNARPVKTGVACRTFWKYCERKKNAANSPLSRSPPAQPSAVMMARSQIRPEASMRAIP